MARLVESVVSEYKGDVHWKKVVTKDLWGAERFMALTKDLGRPAPVPSIFINGELVFETIPSRGALKKLLDRRIAQPD